MNFIRYICITVLVVTTLFAQPLQKVSVQLNWKYQFEFAGYIVAKEKGYYKDIGLDVELKEYQYGMNVVDEVIKGNATYGISNSTILADFLHDKPVVLIASIFKRSALVIVTKPSIKTLDNLIGKKLMATYTDMSELRFMFKEQNIDTKKIDIVPHSFNIQDFIDGKVDAMTAYKSDQLYKLDKLGIKYKVFDPSDYGVYAIQSELFTTVENDRENRAKVLQFKQATVKGWEYALKHKKEIVELIYKKYSKNISKDELINEAKIISRLIMPHTYKIGSVDINFLERQLEMYKEVFAPNSSKTLSQFLSKDLFGNMPLYMTQKEQKYIEKKKVIKVCTNPDWAPIEFSENGKPQGIAIDTLEIIAKNIGIGLEYIPSHSWSESQKLLKEKKCDILPSAIKTKKREEYAIFTKPYLKYDLAIITTNDKSYVESLDTIIDKPMVRKKGSGVIAKLKNKYPNINIIETVGTKEAFIELSHKKAYFTVATLPVLSYYKNMLDIRNIHIAGYTKMKYNLSIAVRKDEPILMHILDEALEGIDSKTHNIIYEKWTKKTIEYKTDYKLLIRVMIVSFVIILIILFFMIKQKRLNEQIVQLNKDLEYKVAQAIKDTQKKEKLLQQQSRLAQMGEMLSMIAHQWRQPLSAIASRAGNLTLQIMLKKEIDNKMLKGEMDKIIEYTQHLSETINEFRNFFKQNKTKKETSCVAVVNSVLSIVETALNNKNITIVKEFDENAPSFELYENELKQVVLNLIKNAEDILIEKEIQNATITIKVYDKVIVVSDNGGGIKDSIIDKIFDPYFSTKKKKDGTGLGLYMSKVIIEEHCGGKLTVTNDKFGAVFAIDLNGGGNKA